MDSARAGNTGRVSGSARNHALDGLRGLAALAVVVLHVWMYTEKGAHARDEPIRMALGELRIGVVLFFVLSGFLLARPWVSASLDGRPPPHPGRYALRRLARIVPGYWLALLGAMLVLQGAGPRYELGLPELPLFALFAQNYVGETIGRLDPPMWSLVVEMSFYLLLPLLGWAIVRGGGRTRALGLCALLVVAGMAWTAIGVELRWPQTAMKTLPVYLPAFACGIVAAVLCHGRRLAAWQALALSSAGTVAVALNAVWHSDGTGWVGHVVLDLPAAAGFAAVVGAVALRPPRSLASAPLRGLGTISYGVYLWHFPILIWLRAHESLPTEHVLAALARVVPLTIAIATVSWLAVERPALRAASHLERRSARRRDPAAVPA